MARNSTLADPNAGRQDSQSTATGASNKCSLTGGLIYHGAVTAITGSCYDVEIEGSGLKITQCRYALGPFLGMVGYRSSGRLSIGDRVAVLGGQPNYIIATMPRDRVDEASPRSRTHTGYGVDKLMPENTQGAAHTYPNDMMEGEFEIANMLGMAMVFATNLISMQAGDRAKVEVMMVNDMVRMISNEFRHHSAIGDDLIYDDGRLNAESNYTHYRHESHGKPNADDELATLPGNQYQPETSDVDAELDTGLWRASLYKGWLGDFMHWFISDPQNAVARIGEEGFRSGRSRIWTGSDGTVLVQSTSDIILERVVRVQVPRRKKHYDDPTGNTPKDFTAMPVEFLKNWKDSDPNKPWERAFQLRQYGRWLSQKRSFARFHAADKDWEVPSIEDVPAPDKWMVDKEAEKADKDAGELIDAYATIRIYRDGSIGAEEVGGASLVMSHGSVWLSASRHLHLEAAGDVRIIAGQNILLKARRSVDIVAVVGGIMLKSRTWLRALCEWGSVWIKSDAKDPSEKDYEEQVPDDEETDPKPAVLEHAVVIQASKGKTQIKSARRVHIKCVGPADSPEPGTSADILLESKAHDVVIKSANAVNVFADKIGMESNYLVAKTKRVKWAGTTLFDIDGTLVIRNKKVSATEIDTTKLNAPVISGNPVGVMTRKGMTPPKVASHNNHVHFLPDDFEVKLSDTDETGDFAANGPGAAPIISNTPMSFTFISPAEYNWDGDETTGKNRYKSPTQQNMTIALSDSEDLKEWDWSAATQKLKPAPETNSSSTPYGYQINFNTHTAAGTSDGSGVLMNKVQNTVDVKNSATGWTSKPMKFIFRM